MADIDYKPVKEERLFCAQNLYSHINWNDVDEAVRKFDELITNWYIQPAQCLQDTHGDYSFGVVAFTCILVDTLSQYYAGSRESSQTRFKQFLTDHDPDFATVLPTAIRYSVRGDEKQATTLADVIYAGFRCGILHEAHVPLYGAIVGHGKLYEFHHSGYVTYADGTDCPCVVLDPKGIFYSHSHDLYRLHCPASRYVASQR